MPVNEFRVTALKLGTVGVDKSAMTYMSGPGTPLVLPVWAAAVEGAGLKILIDTGISDHTRWDAGLNPCWREDDEQIETALSQIGWSVADVDIVINSHLHYDHAENNTLFRNSTLIVSRAEWEYAQAPIPSQVKLYDFAWTDEVVSVLNYQLIAVDDHDVVPGLRLIQTPGHSRGHQSVLLNTAEGTLCVAGDAACLPENFTRPTPPGGATSIEQGFASLERIRRSATRLLMNHDPNITKYQDARFPEVPEAGARLPAGSIQTLPPGVQSPPKPNPKESYVRRIRRVHAGLATLAIAGVLATAACGPGSAGSASGGPAGGASGGSAGSGSGQYASMLASASQMTPSHYEGPTTPAKAPTGIKIAAITCYSILEGCVIPAEGIAKAAADIGWTERTYDGGGTPTTQNAQILNAVSWGAKVIALIAITPSAVQTGLQAAKKAGALIISGSSGLDSPNPTVNAPAGDIWPAFDVSPDYVRLGQNLGDWIIADSGGKADVAVYGDREFDSINAQQTGIVPALNGCKTCTVSPVMYFSATQISSALGPEVVSYLRTHPSVNYIYGAYDPPTVAMVTAIQNAGLAHQVQIASALGNSQNLHLVAAGQVEAADAAYDNTYMGFAMVDQTIRMLDHMPLFQPLGENLPFQVLTKNNLPSDLNSWTAPFNYQAQFVKLWKG